jgi:hypothetical protein
VANKAFFSFKIGRFIREILSILFWAFLISKLLIFDADNLLIRSIFPQCDWLITYKFVFILLTLAIFWLLLGSKKKHKSVRPTLLTRQLKGPGDRRAFPVGLQIGEPAVKEIEGPAKRWSKCPEFIQTASWKM